MLQSKFLQYLNINSVKKNIHNIESVAEIFSIFKIQDCIIYKYVVNTGHQMAVVSSKSLQKLMLLYTASTKTKVCTQFLYILTYPRV